MPPDPPSLSLLERFRGRGGLLTALGAAFAIALLGGAAWLLADAQSNEREQLRERYANGSTIASALVDSLFFVAFRNTRIRAETQFSGEVSAAGIRAYARAANNVYVAVLDGRGRTLAATARAPRQVDPALVRMASSGDRGYALGDVEQVGAEEVLPSVVRFDAAGETRFLATGAPLAVYRDFLGGTLQPLVRLGGNAYVLDGRGRELGAVSASRPDRPPPPDEALRQRAGRGSDGLYEAGGTERYFASESVAGSAWNVAVTAPTAELYAPSSGVRRWLPWVVLGVLALALLAIGYLVRRALQAGARIAAVNRRLESSNAELQRSNAELEQFAYVASHDLSAPLRAVAGFSQLLASRYRGRLDEDADEFIGHMGAGVNRMQRIIDDLLAYSRVGRGDLRAEPVELDAVLEAVLDGLSADVSARDAVVTREPLGRACGEAGQLSQVLQNLMTNAMKFTAEGVRPEVHVSARRADGRVHVSVRDNGIGIDPDQAERIFKMFQRLHGEGDYEGTGIGLAIAQKIVERHGGRLRVEPAPTGGTVFTFDVADGEAER